MAVAALGRTATASRRWQLCCSARAACGLRKWRRVRVLADAPSTRQTVKLTAVTATVGGDYDLGTQKFQPQWQLETAVGRAVDVRLNQEGCTVSKNWDADLGALSCNVELKAHCNWNGRVRRARLLLGHTALCSPVWPGFPNSPRFPSTPRPFARSLRPSPAVWPSRLARRWTSARA